MSASIDNECLPSQGSSVSHLLCATKRELQDVVLGRRYARNGEACRGGELIVV